jgi:hypothetical protein
MQNWKPNTTGKVPSELREGDVIDIMFADGDIAYGTDGFCWGWSLPDGDPYNNRLILAYRLVKKAEPVRETHVAEASLFPPNGDHGWITGHSDMGDHKFYLHFETVDGKIDYDSMRASEVPF